ncbi:hypothetical protein MMC24_001639 [Lignoscripta atroalba]|nr:hypothetical protein [Lignoscripta atroalba]
MGRTIRPQSNGDSEKNIWSGLLDSVASGKRLPEKNILVLGGTPDTQKDFLGTLASETSKRPQDRHRQKPQVANEFALGYTYQDVLDADHEDIIARLSIYLLSEPSRSFASLLKPLLKKSTIADTLVVILLDWAEPWLWIRQLRDWIRLLREVLFSLDDDVKEVMGEVMQDWQQRRRGASAYDAASNSGVAREANVTIPLSPGEWDEGLGLPLCVVCQNSDRIESLEKEQGWREEEFDFVLQFQRTILMKHGASLVYTSPSSPNALPTLIHSTLGIHSLLKRQPLKHNVVDRDKVLIPPNWDSWGKITVLREGLDVKSVSEGWSIDIQIPERIDANKSDETNGNSDVHQAGNDNVAEEQNGSLSVYEDTILNPKKDETLTDASFSMRQLEVTTSSNQDFLASQAEVMERLKADEDQQDSKDSRNTPTRSSFATQEDDDGPVEARGRVNDHIGPVQFNMGGIQVDAEDMLKRLKGRDRDRTPEREAQAVDSPDGKSQNEALANFFADLIKRGGSNSPRPHAT